FRTKREIFAFIDRERGGCPLKRMCALYGVTRVGYYAWRHRGESARRGQDRGLLRMIRTLFETSRGTYGSPRIHQALRAAGTRVSRRRVERLMREAGLRARAVKLYRRIPGLHGFFTNIPNRQLDRQREASALAVNEREDLPLRSEQNRMAFFKSSCSSRSIACSRSSVCSRLISRTRRPSTTPRRARPLRIPSRA